MGASEMKPGDVRLFKKGNGNAVVLAAGLWAEKRGKQLHIHITGTKTFHTTVTNDPDSERYHRTLFRDLRRLLLKNDCWPFGDEGAETEQATRVI
jgi:glycine/D-amino acid oxidase-like deaminating enzyme